MRLFGFATIRNATRENSAASPYAQFFDGYLAVVEKHILSQGEIRAAFEAQGFTLLAHDRIWHRVAQSWAEHAQKAEARADSQLLRLDDADFQCWLERMRAHGESGEGIGARIDLFTFGAD